MSFASANMGFISYLIIHFFLVVLLQTCFVFTQNIRNGSVPVGESITASDTQQFSRSWRSPSGDFAFGFRKILPNDGFTLSIWFDKIHGKTIVWHAQTVNTITGLIPDGSKVTLTADRGLVLTDPKGQLLWRSILSSNSGSISHGRIDDDGNFGLVNEGSQDSGKFVWSSFDNPTDTLLPNQIIEGERNLSSRRTKTSFKKGRFRLSLRPGGDLQLLTLNSNTLNESDIDFSYYASNTKDPNPGTKLVFNQSGYIYVLQKNNSRTAVNKVVPVSSRDFYHRVVLHFDGVLAQYYHSKGDGSDGWVFAWAVPENICRKFIGSELAGNELGNLACGFNNVCSLGNNQRPRCECPEKFVLKDPSDEYGDCEPHFEMQTCGPENNQTGISSNTDYGFITLKRTNWPSGDYMRYKNYDEETCKTSCLNDCFCAAVVYGTDGVCWKKKFPLSYGETSPSVSSDTLIKISKRVQNDVTITGKRVKDHDWLIIACSVLFGTSAFVNFIFLALYRKGKKSKKIRKNQTGDISAAAATATANELNLKVFTYGELAAATRDFMDELGRGSFGIVYKGMLKGPGASELIVAVKKLDRIAQENEKEFKNEVKVIGQIHHKNLVRLIGFCNEGQSRMIVYEFLPHGTVASFLFTSLRPSWEDRTRIAAGIASGILYLHEECSEQIIHCDIKPQNILLDENYNPRISDFGLSKLLMMNQTHTITNIRGTKGYVAAEWFRNSPITSKVDVYSYGVMLLEIVCCKKAVDLETSVILIDWAYDCYRHGKLVELIKDDLEAIENIEIVNRYVKIAIWCIQEEPNMRPNMRNVTQMLEGVAQVHDPPNPSPYSTITCYESLSNCTSHVNSRLG